MLLELIVLNALSDSTIQDCPLQSSIMWRNDWSKDKVREG